MQRCTRGFDQRGTHLQKGKVSDDRRDIVSVGALKSLPPEGGLDDEGGGSLCGISVLCDELACFLGGDELPHAAVNVNTRVVHVRGWESGGGRGGRGGGWLRGEGGGGGRSGEEGPWGKGRGE